MTVLVCGCGLFESDEYLEGLDAEGQAGVMRAFQQACEQAIRDHEGTVVQSSEAGLLACFGYPVAYEDAAHRATRSGLAILEGLNALGERLRREQTLELDPWVGIHTGPAVAEAGRGLGISGGRGHETWRPGWKTSSSSGQIVYGGHRTV